AEARPGRGEGEEAAGLRGDHAAEPHPRGGRAVGGRADPAGQHLTSPLTVVVPVYNEGKNFREWWRQASPHLPPGAQVRVVYDFDEDDTLPVVRELAGQGAPVVPLKNAGKRV